MQEVYLLISNFESRSKVHGVCSIEKAIENFNIIVSIKPDSWIKEESSKYNVKFYDLVDGTKVFKEHIYIEKRPYLDK